MLLSIPEFIGHLHPVIVHLPIGILLLACLFLWQSRKDRSEDFQRTINIILGLGMISAIAACITGFILSRIGEYEEGLAGWHQWMGISVALVSIITFYFRRKKKLVRWQSLMASILLVLIFITGHLGGSLTHGTDYLTSPLEDQETEDTAVIKAKPIAQVQEAIIYGNIIEPIFQRRCYSCHGPNRQKGKLRLDQPDRIMKGGKDGEVIKPGNADSSEIVKRIFLPLENEHHMAPKEKKQLTASEKTLIRWWIEEGADFTKKVKDVRQPDKLKPILLALQNPANEDEEVEWPVAPVEKADPAAIARLKELGALVQPISQKSNYLEINFLSAPSISAHDLSLLIPIKKQLVRIKAGGKPVTDSGLAYIGQCDQLISLQLDHTNISDRGLEYLDSLHNLRVLNLVGTNITVSGVLKLKGMTKLRSLYLYQTKVNKLDWPSLQKSFPKVKLDSGGYAVPRFNTDTMTVKPPKLTT